MTEGVKEIGRKFKTKREEMHLSLKEVENATSIRMMYLQAIEEGSVGKYLSPVYALGFIKQYASFLGFNGEKIVKENPIIFNVKKNQEFDCEISTIDVRNSHSKSKKTNFWWVIISLFLLVAAWYFAKFLKVI